jgi:hypothetical protein
MWIQEGDNKPIYVPIRDKQKADKIAQLGSFELKGKKYTVVGFADKNALDAVISVFYDKSTTTNYDKLRANIEQFKQTKIWPT